MTLTADTTTAVDDRVDNRSAAALGATESGVSGPPTLHVFAPYLIPVRPPTLSSIKALLWADALTRSTRLIRPVATGYRAHFDTETLGFWEFLDRSTRGRRFEELDAADLSALYRKYRLQPWRPPPESLAPYAREVAAGWIHPAGLRILELFTEYARELNATGAFRLDGTVEQPANAQSPARITGLASGATPTMLAAAEVAEAYGRPAPPHILRALHELAPAMRRAEPIVVLHDTRSTNDYVVLAQAVARHASAVRRLALGDLSDDLPGAASPATLADLDRIVAHARQTHGDAAMHLGLRLYFLAVAGRGERHRLHPGLLSRWISRAGHLLEHAQNTAADVAEALVRSTTHGYVSPHRLTSELLSRRPMPRKDLLRAVYV